MPITSVTVPPFLAVPELELPVDDDDELPQAAITTTAPTAASAVRADLESLLIEKVLLQRGFGWSNSEMY